MHVAVAFAEFDPYAALRAFAHEVMARHNVIDFMIIHRSGRIAPGQAIVLVAALAPHRASAFAAVEEMTDYLKTDAPFWKRERRIDGDRWIEPTIDDHYRRAAHDAA